MGKARVRAIEDAVVLDQCFSGTDDLEAALRPFEERRVTRANSIVQASWRFGEIAQWRNPVAAWLRNSAMRATPASLKLAQARKLMRADT